MQVRVFEGNDALADMATSDRGAESWRGHAEVIWLLERGAACRLESTEGEFV